MEKGGTHMKFKSHIPKPLLLSRLKLTAVGLFTALTCLFINPITAHAVDLNVVADNVIAEYNGTSDSNRGGTSAIVNGVAYTRTGYLCYLLTKDGSPTGDPAYAFYSPGYNGIAGSRWVCTSRRGHTVSSWYDVAPWGVTPWGNGGSPSYEPDIRDWMLQPIDGAPQAYAFVQECWGEKAAKNFMSDEYILVLETIMNFQYSVKGGNGGGGSLVDRIGMDNIVASCYNNIRSQISESSGRSFYDIPRDNKEKAYMEKLAQEAAKIVVARLRSEEGTNRTFTSDPLIGTVPNLITYKNGNTVFDSYTNKVAPHSEKIKVNEAGFTAYTGKGSGPLSDSEVQSYGVAMLIIHCKSDAIHTYWQPNGSPGNPEPSIPGKTGTCNIVKGYYKENLTTGAKQSLGVYSELDVTSNIIVSGEPNFELVEWRVTTATSTTATSTTVNPIAWNPPGTPTQQGKTGATLSLKDPEDCVYVLLF